MALNIGVPEAPGPQLKPRITVIGVGGAGGNAVNNMIQSELQGVEFVVANTDAQALAQARTDRRLQLGVNVTQGLGAGARPDIGQASAEEAIDQIRAELEGSNMAFITAGMGGGTGTGAAPVVARVARELGVLTVGVVTKPFDFEGKRRMTLADQGIEELTGYVDTLIIIPNQNLFRVANEKTTFADAFKMADDVLHSGVRSVTDLMIMPGLINLDFADVRTVMSEMGKAMMGTGEADGERRALDAAEMAIANPLLDDTSMAGARGVIINITGGSDLTLYEVDEAANRIRDEVDADANIIFGSCYEEALEGRMRVSVVATGIAAEGAAVQPRPQIYAIDSHPPVRPEPAAVDERDSADVTIRNGRLVARSMPIRETAAEEPAHTRIPAGMNLDDEIVEPEDTAEPPASPEPAALKQQLALSMDHTPAEEMPARETAARETATKETSGRAGPVAGESVDADVFVPKQPASPGQRTRAAEPSPAPEHRMNSIHNLAKTVWRGLQGAEPDRPATEEPPQRDRSEADSRPAARRDETLKHLEPHDEDLEIPSFLRRQAN